MLDEYIKELIAQNNRVIIPNFGAFLLRATSKNKNKKELSAKIHDIYFSPFLKFNDELLMNRIIKKEDLSQKEVMDKIAEYIKTIENSVKEKEKYSIEGLGEFYMDNQGKIQFKIQPSGRQEESKGPAPTTTGRADEKKETPKASATINEKAAQRKKSTTQEKSEEQSKSKTPPREPSTSQTKGEPVPEKESVQSKTPPPAPPKKGSIETGKSGSKGNRGLILSVVIGVPVAVLFIWAMLNFDTIQDLFTGDRHPTPVMETMDEQEKQEADTQEKDKQEAQDQPPEQTPIQDSEDTQDKQKVESAQQQVKQASEGKKYYIVAGSFKNRQNALKFHEKLLNEGYNAEMIGERDGMHAVSYASFKIQTRAERELQKLRNEKGLQAWLLYY